MSSFWGPNFCFLVHIATLLCGEPYPFECQVAVSMAVDEEARFFTLVASYESTQYIINSNKRLKFHQIA